MQQKDDFALRRTVRIFGGFAVVGLIVVAIAVVAVHRAPPKPILGSDTAASAVALAMPAAPGSPVVSQPAPPGQAVPAQAAAEMAPVQVAPVDTAPQSQATPSPSPMMAVPVRDPSASATAELTGSRLRARPLPSELVAPTGQGMPVSAMPSADSVRRAQRPRKHPLMRTDTTRPVAQPAPTDSGAQEQPVAPPQKRDTAGGTAPADSSE